MACGPPPCPGFPGPIPVTHGIVEKESGTDWQTVDALIIDKMEQACIPGLSLAISTPEGVAWSSSYGWADLEMERPVTPQTPFMLASVSKMMAGLSVVHAHDQGALSLNDRITRHINMNVANPRLSNRQPPMRIKHLVTHSSGIRDDWDTLHQRYVDGDSPIALHRYLGEYLMPDGRWYSARKNYYRWESGEVWMYSNVGAALAARVVERATGMSYPEYTRQHFFAPLQMDQTHWFLADFDDPSVIARPYTFTEDGDWRVLEHYGYPTYPDGQLRGTAQEIARVLSMVTADGRWQGQQVLSKDAVRTLLHQPIPQLSSWYLDEWMVSQRVFWFEIDLDGRRLIGHNGDDFGVSTEVFFDPKTDIGVAVLMNLSDGEREGQPRNATLAIQHRLYQIGEQL